MTETAENDEQEIVLVIRALKAWDLFEIWNF
jgi:hypothetical protein